MKRRAFLQNMGFLTAAAVAVASGVPIPKAEQVAPPIPDVPGIGGETFKIVIDHKFIQGDIYRLGGRSGEYYVTEVIDNLVKMVNIETGMPLTMEVVALQEEDPRLLCSAYMES